MTTLDINKGRMSGSRALIAITMGDAAGIGPEVIAKSYALQPDLLRNCFVVGDVATMRRAASLAPRDGLPLPVMLMDNLDEAVHVPPRCIPVLQVGESFGGVEWGRVNAQSGEFAGRCVVWAADAALRGEVAAMVTAPLHKEAFHAAGAPYDEFPGHTELLQSRAAKALGLSVNDVPVRMMLANDSLRTVLLSIHMSLRDALDAVTHTNLLQTLRITRNSMVRMLGREPIIAVAGLNPHAGEGGLFGREEIDVIAPAIAAAQQEGAIVLGPFAPDTVFMRARNTPEHRGEFDVVVAMYHDQGLIPVKYAGLDEGVNVTLGLPFVRTSPDHGTAFDIAGKGVASPVSLLQAIKAAKLMTGRA
jgi:4-hydroxythreonine-4-phosphate dehydrogenase